MKILVINSGSSSLKFTLFEMEGGSNTVIASGLVERVGTPTPNLIIKRPDGFKFEESPEGVKNHSDGLRAVCAKLVDPQIGVLKSLSEVKAIGHRVLHGGEKVTAPVKVDEAVKDIIRECIPLGPLHNPANLSGIEACEEIFAGVPNVAVFDTQFHQTMPPEAYLYAIPMDFYKKYGIRKYGFHGTSHRFVTLSTAEFLGKKPEDITIITCHLGNGCSMAAVKNGKVIDTTMGLTPLEGLMMGTRSGDMDPAAVLRMVQVGNTAQDVDTILNKKSGLLAIGGIGSGDMRDIVNAADSGNKDAALALKMFIRRIDVHPPHRQVHRLLLRAPRRRGRHRLHRRHRRTLPARTQGDPRRHRLPRHQVRRREEQRMLRQGGRHFHRRQRLEGDRHAHQRRVDDRP